MNINVFFVGISLALLMIFIGFKPLDIKQQEFVDIPLFQLEDFTLHELNEKGLITLMKGTKATRYANRYKVANMNYTDNSKEFVANMKSDDGVYKDKEEVIDLKGNVLYNREDGLIFESDEASYNKKTSIAKTNKNYVIYRDANRVVGTSLIYNNSLNRVKSKNVVAKYQIKER
ncbi:LPS export ABC transporter periplasmic protein LptC [Sulfurimonas sp.]|uniref:LPS export ABC transporter periplasmic protein LptC n=1 Tax=Sulfurimonas sp. TaxID=2022749 RepID=UPI00356B485D